MTEYVHLVGAEEVSRASHRMSSAADDMNNAAMSIDSTLTMALNRFEELVQRLESSQKESHAEWVERTSNILREGLKDIVNDRNTS